MRFDAVIVTKDPAKIRPALLKRLNGCPYVSSVIIETSVPLSVARRDGALRASTEWVAEFDDDVEICDGECPRSLDCGEWFPKAVSMMAPNVAAISPVYDEQNPHMAALLALSYRLHGGHPERIPTARICTMLIRRSAFEGYEPPDIFHCEDDYLYSHVTKFEGEWVHFMGHARHWFSFKDETQTGRNLRLYHIESGKRVAGQIGIRFMLAVPAAFKTRSPRTVWLFWRWNLQMMWGYVTA